MGDDGVVRKIPDIRAYCLETGQKLVRGEREFRDFNPATGHIVKYWKPFEAPEEWHASRVWSSASGETGRERNVVRVEP